MGLPAEGMAEQERTLLELCALAPADCLARLAAREGGLTGDEAEERLKQAGPNEVGQKQGGFLAGLFRRFANPLVIQLLIIAGVSFLM
ncbi:MAG: cation-transporting P-type ATPase, partial [Spirochaetes bacterium]|nr:cation-transporting P-type ATPase [Spirochaetota bacterium]